MLDTDRLSLNDLRTSKVFWLMDTRMKRVIIIEYRDYRK